MLENQVKALPLNRRLSQIIETFGLVWLDLKFDEIDEDHYQLARLFHSIKKFTDPDQCVDFLTDIELQKVFLIISSVIVKQIISCIHDIPQIHSIFVLCHDTTEDQSWSNEYEKIKGFLAEISSISDLLMRSTRYCDEDFTPISIVSSSITNKQNELQSSFMYSRLLRETIIERIEFDNKQAKHDLIDFYRTQNEIGSDLIDEFNREFDNHTPIWWYTKSSFIYSVLNRALRTQDVEVLIKLGFFMKKLHEQIEEIHCGNNNNNLSTTITVYRGQAMHITEFEKLKQNQGGLISFNNFLSTSLDEQVSYLYADSIQSSTDENLIGIFFQMKIDPLLTNSYPFAGLDRISYYSDQEREILFSMHTVFRIVEIKQIEHRLWQINLILTNDHDEQLRQLTDHMRKEIFQETGWLQFGQLLHRMGLFDQALRLYETLLYSTNIETCAERSFLHHQVGFIYAEQKQQIDKALKHFRMTLSIELIHEQEDHERLASICNNIGAICYGEDCFEEALIYFQKALSICLDHVSAVDPEWIAGTYNNIALIYCKQSEYKKAIENYQQSIELKLNHLPSNHPSIALSYTNIGDLYYRMQDYRLALEYHQKALDIQQRTLPDTHISIATTHYGIAKALEKLNQTNEAIIHVRQALYISECARNSTDESEINHYQAELDRLCNKYQIH